jgi:hypothetical protein
MQIIFVSFACAAIVWAIFSFADVVGHESATRFDAPAPPSWGQPIALVLLGAVSLGAAFILQDGRSVRIPTPAKLDELAGRAEATAVERARQIAEEQSASSGDLESRAQPTE